MTDAPLTPEDERVIARAARLHLYHTLTNSLGTSPAKKRSSRGMLLGSTISDYVDGVNPDPDHTIRDALVRGMPNSAAYRLYEHLLKLRAVAKEAVVLIGAFTKDEHTEDEHTLFLEGGTLYWRATPEGSKQELALQVDDDVATQDGSKPVLHLEWENHIERVLFDEFVDGTAHVDLDSGDRRMQRLIADATRTGRPITRYRIVLS